MREITIKTNYKLSAFKQWLFALVALDSKRMFWFWASVLFFQQMISASIEYVFWGERFVNLVDIVATVTTGYLYFYYQSELGKFLLSMILSEEKEVNQ